MSVRGRRPFLHCTWMWWLLFFCSSSRANIVCRNAQAAGAQKEFNFLPLSIFLTLGAPHSFFTFDVDKCRWYRIHTYHIHNSFRAPRNLSCQAIPKCQQYRYIESEGNIGETCSCELLRKLSRPALALIIFLSPPLSPRKAILHYSVQHKYVLCK